MKYTKKHLEYPSHEIVLPYINLVMKNIIIKKGVKINVMSDGEIRLELNNGYVCLFYDLHMALQKRVKSDLKKYKNFIQMETIEKTIMEPISVFQNEVK